MNKLRYALLAIGLLGAFSACDVEVDDLEPYDFEDRAAALSCSAISNETEVCIGNATCHHTDSHGNTTYQFMPPGGCPTGWTKTQVNSVADACGAANLLTDAPVCPDGCAGPRTSTSKTASCCTKRKTCYDKPDAADVEEVEEVAVDDADQVDDAEPAEPLG